MSSKYYFSLLILIGLIQQVDAQDRRFNAGILLGANLSQIQGDDEAGYSKIGLFTGLNVQIKLKDKTEIGVELALSQLGSRSTNNSATFFPFKSTLNYVNVPVYFKYKDWLNEEEQYYRLHFLGGLSYGRLFSTKMEGSPFVDVDDFLREDYVGILFGAIYYINSQLGVCGRWERGIIDLYNNNFDEGPDISRGSLWSKHLTLYVTYSFL